MKQVRVEWTEVSTIEYASMYDVPDDWDAGEVEDTHDEDGEPGALLKLILGYETNWLNPVSVCIDERWITSHTVYPASDLVLPDGTVHAGRLQLDADGEPMVNMAICGTCDFHWNDALITGVTPTPAGRCPNEYAHE